MSKKEIKNTINEIEQYFKYLTDSDKWRCKRERHKYAEEGYALGFLMGNCRKYGRYYLRDCIANKDHNQLYIAVWKLGELLNISFNVVQVNKTQGNEKLHQDEHNDDPERTYVMSFGSYTKGGRLYLDDTKEKINCKHKLFQFDSRRMHRPLPNLNGDRYSLVFFTIKPYGYGCRCMTNRCMSYCKYKKKVIDELKKKHQLFHLISAE